MARPCKCRHVNGEPAINYFKPCGRPLRLLTEVVLSIDELESIRLADLKGWEQAKAAGLMKISRPTFGRIVGKARRIIADALVNGKALKIEGGDYITAPKRKFHCPDCKHICEIPYGTERPANCPKCRSKNIHRAKQGRGYARYGGTGHGPCGKGHYKKPKS